MGMIAPRIGYKNVTQAAAATIKSGPAALYYITVTVSTGGTVTVYDGTSTSGTTVLFTKASLAAGDVIHFGGNGIAANLGLHVVCGGTCTVNVGYV